MSDQDSTEQSLTQNEDQITQEDAQTLVNDLTVTKLIGGITLWRYKHYFDFVDKRGQILKLLNRTIIDHMSTSNEVDENYKKGIQYEFSDDAVIVRHPVSGSHINFGLTASGFSRERMIPTTINSFKKDALAHFDEWKKQFDGIEELNTLGFRVQQLNHIQESEFQDFKDKFVRQQLKLSSIITWITNPTVKIDTKSSIIQFRLYETFSSGSKVHSYSINLTAGFGTGKDANDIFGLNYSKIKTDIKCFFTDIDIYSDEEPSNILVPSFFNRAASRAVEIHEKMLLEFKSHV